MPTTGTSDRRDRVTGDVLTRKALNRALLARQHLVERSDISAEEMVAHLVGLQAQAPNPPYYGLWTRSREFQTDDLSLLIEQRRVVRIALMRSTIHLVTAVDCLALRPIMASVHLKGFKNAYGRFLCGLDYEEIAAAGRALVEEQPRTFKELAMLLGERWPDRESNALAQTVRTFVPLVQVPPRGLWGQSGQSAHTSAEFWLGQPLPPAPDPAAMIRRYLAAFGPASVQDMQTWCGLTGLRQTVERIRPELITFRDERGRELFDLPDAPRPHPETPVPPRFLPEFDNALLSHDDRTRIISDEYRKMVFTVNGIVKGTVLLDGFVAGTWKTKQERNAATLMINFLRSVDDQDRALLKEEGIRLLAFAAPNSANHDIRFTS